ncbi:hypothetical protein AAF712_004952 [Marasmius tenuissimus]|uniref:Uncharacterized protein n=1 Tax=Marasmius tenuissimus TaxID=585030 RepID=A0ABR3A4X0_9AGAR
MGLLANSYDISHVSGNVPDNVKRTIAHPSVFVFPIDGEPEKGTGHSDAIVKRMVVTEVSVLKSSEEPSKDVGRVVCELEVAKDMVNRASNLHGGCSAYLVDICSSLALIALSMVKGGFVNHVSQSINMVYHSPAARGQATNCQYDDDHGFQDGIGKDRGLFVAFIVDFRSLKFGSLSTDLERNSPPTGCLWGTYKDAAV